MGSLALHDPVRPPTPNLSRSAEVAPHSSRYMYWCRLDLVRKLPSSFA
jgi:hypothetical protein